MLIDIPDNIEQYTKSVIFKDLSKGDPKRDVPHTQAVVYYSKQILSSLTENSPVDPLVVVIAAYAHDWGYSPFFREGKSLGYDEYMLAKTKHMPIGAELTKNLLSSSVYNLLSKAQKERIIHLVEVHDDLSKIIELDEKVLMEADTLGGLDTDYMKPTFTPEGNEKYLKAVVTKRRPLFETDFSKEAFDSLLMKRVDYYSKGLWQVVDDPEYLDIVDQNDEIIGKKLRSDITKNDIYRVSSLWVFDKDKNLLISQRPTWKKHDPGKWTESAVGTVPHGETYEQTMVREAEEELGLVLSNLTFVSKRYHTSENGKMFGSIYAVVLDTVRPNINNDVNEVPCVEWIDSAKFIEELKAKPNRFVDGLESFYSEVWSKVANTNTDPQNDNKH